MKVIAFLYINDKHTMKETRETMPFTKAYKCVYVCMYIYMHMCVSWDNTNQANEKLVY